MSTLIIDFVLSCCVNWFNTFRKCKPNPEVTVEMCILKEANVGGRSTPLGLNIKMVKCDMDEVCEQRPGIVGLERKWFPHFG